MDRAQAKIFLKRYRRLIERQRQIRDRLEHVEETATSTTAKLDGMPRASGTGDKVGRGAISAADFKTKLKRLEEETRTAEQEIFFVIDSVEDKDRAEILYRHYIGGENLVAIAVEMHYTDRWITTLHGRALDDVARILEKIVPCNSV